MMDKNVKSSAITRVALLAVGNRDAALLWMMVNRFMAADCVIGEAASADIAILDGDAQGFPDALGEWQANHPGAPSIVLALKPPAKSPDVAYVRKPVHVPELLTVLGGLRNGVRTGVPLVRPAAAQEHTVQTEEQAKLSIPAPLPRHVDRTHNPSSEVLSVDICMSMDPVEVFDTIGIKTDISGGFRHSNPMTDRLPQARTTT